MRNLFAPQSQSDGRKSKDHGSLAAFFSIFLSLLKEIWPPEANAGRGCSPQSENGKRAVGDAGPYGGIDESASVFEGAPIRAVGDAGPYGEIDESAPVFEGAPIRAVGDADPYRVRDRRHDEIRVGGVCPLGRSNAGRGSGWRFPAGCDRMETQTTKSTQEGSQMNIRYADMSDLAAVTAVEAACFPPAEAATQQDFAQRLRYYSGHFWLMFDGGTLIAFVDGFVTDEPDLTDDMYENAALHNENGAWQMIFGVNTLPEYRQHGYAGELLRRAIDDARKQGRKGLVLTCKERLIHYYARFGFVDEGVSEKSTHGNVVWHQMRLTF